MINLIADTDKRCESCLYGKIFLDKPCEKVSYCSCGKKHAGGIPACPNVCTHDSLRADVPTNVALARREEEEIALRRRYNKVTQENSITKLGRVVK